MCTSQTGNHRIVPLFNIALDFDSRSSSSDVQKNGILSGMLSSFSSISPLCQDTSEMERQSFLGLPLHVRAISRSKVLRRAKAWRQVGNYGMFVYNMITLRRPLAPFSWSLQSHSGGKPGPMVLCPSPFLLETCHLQTLPGRGPRSFLPQPHWPLLIGALWEHVSDSGGAPIYSLHLPVTSLSPQFPQISSK